MHKSLLLLGLLLSGPKTGYDLYRIILAHGELYADLKKANVYYLLEHLAEYGHLEMQAEAGARGPRGERLLYSITPRGRERFDELLRALLRADEPAPSTLSAAIVFLPRLPADDARELLAARRAGLAARRAALAERVAAAGAAPVGLALDYQLAHLEADLAWTERALAQLQRAPLLPDPEHTP